MSKTSKKKGLPYQKYIDQYLGKLNLDRYRNFNQKNYADSLYKSQYSTLNKAYLSNYNNINSGKTNVNKNYDLAIKDLGQKEYSQLERNKVMGEMRGITSSAQMRGMDDGTQYEYLGYRTQKGSERDQALSDITKQLTQLKSGFDSDLATARNEANLKADDRGDQYTQYMNQIMLQAREWAKQQYDNDQAKAEAKRQASRFASYSGGGGGSGFVPYPSGGGNGGGGGTSGGGKGIPARDANIMSEIARELYYARRNMYKGGDGKYVQGKDSTASRKWISNQLDLLNTQYVKGTMSKGAEKRIRQMYMEYLNSYKNKEDRNRVRDRRLWK